MRWRRGCGSRPVPHGRPGIVGDVRLVTIQAQDQQQGTGKEDEVDEIAACNTLHGSRGFAVSGMSLCACASQCQEVDEGQHVLITSRSAECLVRQTRYRLTVGSLMISLMHECWARSLKLSARIAWSNGSVGLSQEYLRRHLVTKCRTQEAKLTNSLIIVLNV